MKMKTMEMKMMEMTSRVKGVEATNSVLTQRQRQMTSLTQKLDSQETELFKVKTKLKKVGSDLQDVNRRFQPAANTAVKCPMCSKVVARPMRLQQCPRVSLFS